MNRIQFSVLVSAVAVLPYQSFAASPNPQSQVHASQKVRGGVPGGMLVRAELLPQSWQQAGIADVLKGSHLPADRAAAVWASVADEDTAPAWTPDIVAALVVASDTPEAREAMWAELAGSAGAFARRPRLREPSLASFFEHHRGVLRHLLIGKRETEPSTDAIIKLMLTSRVFGASPGESVAFVSERIPDAVARTIENDHGLGRRVDWKFTAYRGMLKWKATRFPSSGGRRSTTPAELDHDGFMLMTVFNSLQSFEAGMRDGALRGLDPVTLFNAVVAGEEELYRVGTTGYPDVLHAAIMGAIKEAGSFEAFLERAASKQVGDEAGSAVRRRRMALLRIASHFGLLCDVLDTVRDQDRFVDGLITGLGEAEAFRRDSRVMIDLLTARSDAPRAATFKTALLERLYDRYKTETRAAQKSTYGSLLSVYQSVTGDHRNAAIDRAFAIEQSAFHIPFSRLFSQDADGALVHRMFMRMDSDTDASGTYISFRSLMASLGATVREQSGFDVFDIAASGRRIELYANKPTLSGVKQGIANIAHHLKGLRVETIIGRGHTAIIEPLQDDAKRVLGDRLRDAAVVIIGSCGGDSAVADLIATFGYKPLVTTRSTGRQVINNAVIKSYVAALMELAPDDRLAIAGVLQAATARFLRPGADDDLRTDAGLYHVNMANVFTAQVYDAYLRSYRDAERRAALR